MKHIQFILLALPLFWGCTRGGISESQSEHPVTVEITVRPDPMTTATRATDETAIRDLNFYLIDKAGRVVVYRYLTATTLRFECTPGDYLIRIAANIGRSLGADANLSQFRVTYQQEYDTLPMFYEQETRISLSSGGVVQLPPISVKRVVAKISYNLTAKPADMELISVRMMSVPRSALLFAGNDTASTNPDDFTNLAETPLTGRQAAGSYYMLPNLQGVKTSITDQRQKNAENAPGCASWLLIRATRGSKVLAYSVYLGENNTSNFNVRANCHYTLNITILNDNTVDTRIAAYTATVYDDLDEFDIAGYSVYAPDYCLYVDMANDNSTFLINGQFELIQGDRAYFEFDRTDIGTKHDFELYNPKGGNYYYLDYHPPFFTKENSTFAYRVTLTDEYGFSKDYNISHTFANVIYANAGIGGSVTADNSLYSQTAATSSGTRTTVLCHENGCRLTATASDYHMFIGWYADAAYTRFVSSAATYTFIPDNPYGYIYARFKAIDTPLDIKGTANCYIAPTLNTCYSFNATVQGNGKTTKNITPKRISGTSAIVIWETGSVRNAVIASASYENGRIFFQTGSVRGNAVIGLFNAAGECVWSWHIWAVDYNPAAYQQTYSTGAVFMDRNLGAETTSMSDVKAKGLYYQWGRKDPFIYPATNKKTDNDVPATVTALDGYAFKAYDTTNALPAGSYTIEWATAHPTSLLTSVAASAGSGQTYSSTWYTPLNPNLWGNGTDGSNISTTNVKTIYDPCPPGWRVPQPEAWDKAYFKKATYINDSGWYMYYSASGSSTARYPFTGFLDGDYGNMQYYWPAYQVRIWTNTPTLTYSKDYARYIYILDESGIVSVTDAGQDVGITVRCIRE